MEMMDALPEQRMVLQDTFCETVNLELQRV